MFLTINFSHRLIINKPELDNQARHNSQRLAAATSLRVWKTWSACEPTGPKKRNSSGLIWCLREASKLKNKTVMGTAYSAQWLSRCTETKICTHFYERNVWIMCWSATTTSRTSLIVKLMEALSSTAPANVKTKSGETMLKSRHCLKYMGGRLKFTRILANRCVLFMNRPRKVRKSCSRSGWAIMVGITTMQWCHTTGPTSSTAISIPAQVK